MIDEATRRKMALGVLIKILRGGHELSAERRALLADGLEKHIKGDSDPWGLIAQGRPATNIDTFKWWAAFYAAYVDPEFNSLPKSNGGRFQKVGELLNVSEGTARNRANRFRDDGAVWMLPRKAAEKYTLLLGRSFSDDVHAEMAQRQSKIVEREVFWHGL